MLRLILCAAAMIVASTATPTAQVLPGQVLDPANAEEIVRTLDAGDRQGLIDALYQKSISLTAEQHDRVMRAIVGHMSLMSDSNGVEYKKALSVLTTLMMSKPAEASTDVAATLTPKAPNGSPTIESSEIDRAIKEKDGAKAVNLVRSNTFNSASVTNVKDGLIKLILDYARPIPASNATSNKEAYEALAILDPENLSFKQKAEIYASAERDAKNGALKKLKKRTDDFNGITFYSHPAEPRYADQRSYLLPYIAVKDDTVIVRVNLHYTSDSWLFIRKATFNVDGEIIPFDSGRTDWKRDHDSEIWEWVDIPLTSDIKDLLLKVESSKKTIVRFDGQQYYDDFTVTDKDKQAIRDIFAAENILRDAK